MKRVTFACTETILLAPDKISEKILDVTTWPDFHGYSFIPGIQSAVFETRTPEIVGSRIRVTNLDGSSHVEEIVGWQPDRRLQLRMGDFSAPLSRLATSFVETWEFRRVGTETQVVRSFEMNAKSKLAVPGLWLISFFLKRAIAHNMRQLNQETNQTSKP